MNVKNISVGLLFLLVVCLSAQAMQTLFSYVKASPYGDEVLIQWQTQDESNIQSFEIERKSDESIDYKRIGRLDAKGRGSVYTYIDNGAFYKGEKGTQFTYRLRGVGTSNQLYSPTITITHEVSSVRKSWGMIKELFR
jgi:hypothetical protein